MLAVAAVALFPPWQAERRFEAAGQNEIELCEAAKEAAVEWARFGFTGKADQWRDKSGLPCVLAEFYRAERGL